MTTATRLRRAGRRGASSRYLNMAASATTLGAAGGARTAVEHPAGLLAAALELAAGRESIVWLHEDALAAWGFPQRVGDDHAQVVGRLLGAEARPIGPVGWLIIDGNPSVHLACPSYLGDFVGLDTAGELLTAVEAFRQAVGFAYVISGAKTVHTLIESMSHPGETIEEPPLEPPRPHSAWTVPANKWDPISQHLEILQAAGRPWVRCFDRVSSYLAVWQGIALADGDWTTTGPCVAQPGPESGRPAGYWLIERPELPLCDPPFWDPFRQHGDDDGPIWITTPLLQLALDLKEAPLLVRDAVIASERIRPLDKPGARLREAQAALKALDSAPGDTALRVLKATYSASTAWFGHSVRPPAPLARPSWMHTIHDRHAASTWRSLAKATPGPFAFAMNDTALFALSAPDEIPDGLKVDGVLGSWKPKGDPVAIGDAIAAGDALKIIRLAVDG